MRWLHYSDAVRASRIDLPHEIMKTIRIGNGAGFWGDNLDAPRKLAESGQIDYLTLEYLAELTMSILAHLRSRDPNAGYVTDVPTVLASCVPALKAQPGLKIVTNGGGMNPSACAKRCAEVLREAGLSECRIAAVSGDDLLPRIDELMAAGETFENFDTGAAFGETRPKIVSANAYLGAEGIVRALQGAARIIVTGRVADASLTVGPVLHEFGAGFDNIPLLSAATVAGHLIECGAQATGGMYAPWTTAIPLANVGYPIAEICEDGSLAVTKPSGSDGLVSTATVAEQLIYEIGDPEHYLTPDLDADFSQVTLTQDGPDRVRVANASGHPAPPRLKVSMAYQDGWMINGMLTVCGPNATANARAAGRMILDRVAAAGYQLARTNIECLGAGDSMPGVRLPGPGCEPWEVVLRVTAHDPRREALDRLAREFAPLVTSGPPGVTGYATARPEPRRVLAYWPTTIDRRHVPPQVVVRTAQEWLA